MLSKASRVTQTLFVNSFCSYHMRLTIRRLAQIIFMEVLGGVFKVSGQTWQEWLAAIAIGAGAMPVAAIVKFFARCAPRPGCDPHRIMVACFLGSFRLH